jgi:anti-sigma regulatory factor (Ser/Thr protein kinase)
MDDQRPPPSPHQIAAPLQIPLAPSADAPARARSEVTAWLEQDAAPATLIHDAQLLVSELVTNCVRHADISQRQPLRLTGSLRGATFRLEVHDDGIHGTVAGRPPRPDYAGGFGLDLVAQLSSAWGVERDAYGTTVWLELAAEALATS